MELVVYDPRDKQNVCNTVKFLCKQFVSDRVYDCSLSFDMNKVFLFIVYGARNVMPPLS